MIKFLILLGIFYLIVGVYITSILLGILTIFTIASDGSLPGWATLPISIVLGFCWPVLFILVGMFFIARKISA